MEVPPPEVAIDLPMETTTTAIQDVTDKPPPPAPPPPPRVAGTPAKMKSAVEPGRVIIRREPSAAKSRARRWCRLAWGRTADCVREPVVTDTSGFPDLDGAAVKVAKANRYARRH